jgi:hypothetical protein
MRLARVVAALCLGAPILLAGCGGGPPADLFVVQRTGSVPGAALTLRLTDDAGAYCNALGRREVTSEQLIEAREIRRELDGDPRKPEVEGLAERKLRLPASGPTIFAYRVRSEEGVITFHDTSRGYDAVPRILKLTRDVARESCGLAR